MDTRTRYRALSASAWILLMFATTACPEAGGATKPQLRSLTLSRSGAGTGTLTANPSSATYDDGATVSIAATPASGSNFTGWSGDCTGPANPCSIVMSADRIVTGSFTQSTGAGQFDGEYSGTWNGGQSDGSMLSGTLTLTLTNGVLQGTISALSGSLGTFSGTVSPSGALSATVPAGNRGCNVTLSAQVSASSSGGTTKATATGSYVLAPSTTCNTASGTWTAARR